MNDFKSMFNYIVFGLRSLFLIFCIGLLFLFVFRAPSFYADNKFGIKVVLGLAAGIFLFLFLPYRLGKLLLTQRNNIIFSNGDLIFKDAVTSKIRHIDKGNIKGFSTTVYETRAWNFKSIILYFHGGQKIEFPQFLYWNFKDIKPALIDNGLKYLGHEPYRWKWFDTRHYLYD